MKITSNAIIIKNNRILMGKRRMTKKYFPGHWDIVGGHVEKGETLKEAMIREVKEEVGLKVLKFRKIGAIEEKRLRYRHHLYFIIKWKGNARNKGEFVRIRWFTKEELSKIKVGFGLKEFLSKALK